MLMLNADRMAYVHQTIHSAWIVNRYTGTRYTVHTCGVCIIEQTFKQHTHTHTRAPPKRVFVFISSSRTWQLDVRRLPSLAQIEIVKTTQSYLCKKQNYVVVDAVAFVTICVRIAYGERE